VNAAAMIQNAGFRSAAPQYTPGGLAQTTLPRPLAPAQLPDRDRVQGHDQRHQPGKGHQRPLPAQHLRPASAPSGKASVPGKSRNQRDLG
jgi:hypothetical protein